METVDLSKSPLESILDVQYHTKTDKKYIEMPAEQWHSFVRSFGELANSGSIDNKSKQTIQNALGSAKETATDSSLEDLLHKLEFIEELKNDFKQALKEARMIMNGEIEAVTLEEFLDEL